MGVNTLKGYVNDMKYVFTKEGAKSVGGFGTIGSIFPKVWDWMLHGRVASDSLETAMVVGKYQTVWRNDYA